MTTVKFGKFKGETVEVLVLREPDYLRWTFLQPDPSKKLLSLISQAKRLIKKFDSKPFLVRCEGKGCSNTATFCSVQLEDITKINWWCDDCDPYQKGAAKGTLLGIRNYEKAFTLAKGRPLEYLINAIAKAKGLQEPVGREQADDFFSK
jgi:hypothetical protein